MDSIEEKVKDIIAQELDAPRDQISEDAHFVNDLGADSLDMVELVMRLEEEFGVHVPEDAADKIQTVGEAIDYIKQHVES